MKSKKLQKLQSLKIGAWKVGWFVRRMQKDKS